MRIIVAITGASGVQYGLNLIKRLVELEHEIDLVVSDGAKKVMKYEVKDDVEEILSMATSIYDIKDIGAAIASGTHPSDGMIIIPCSMKTLAAVATGFSNNLIHRASDCMLKEERKLVLVLRETPLNLIHLRNMVTAKEAGATILPASPGFYREPQSIDDLVDFVVGKALSVFGIKHSIYTPWDPQDLD